VAEQAAVRKCRTCKIHIPSFAKSETVYQKRGCCGEECALEFGKLAIQKKHEKVCKAQTKARKDKIKTKTEWLTEAQAAVNAYVRIRDRGKPCVSCGKPDNGTHQRHASHYRSVGACSRLRFNLKNVYASCQQCNTSKSGNLLEYRIRLKARYGESLVEWLESQNEPKRFEIEYLKRLKALFNKKTRVIKKRQL
jgi:5-methylcytosine-specific restriction endonuclease McrA